MQTKQSSFIKNTEALPQGGIFIQKIEEGIILTNNRKIVCYYWKRKHKTFKMYFN